MQEFLRKLVEGAAARKEILHFVSAREMVNMILAACDGEEGNPGEYRDYRSEARASGVCPILETTRSAAVSERIVHVRHRRNGPNTSDGAGRRAAIHRMCQAIVHRGPDDEGMFVKAGVGLGMRRLSIIDLAGGHQPVFNEDKTIWIVFNGEIYNFPELRPELQAGATASPPTLTPK